MTKISITLLIIALEWPKTGVKVAAEIIAYYVREQVLLYWLCKMSACTDYARPVEPVTSICHSTSFLISETPFSINVVKESVGEFCLR